MNGSCALTTFDNPYNPFEQFSDWFLFDVEKGYNTCAYLDRIAHTSDQFSEEENTQEIERAIDEIIRYEHLQESEENEDSKSRQGLNYRLRSNAL